MKFVQESYKRDDTNPFSIHPSDRTKTVKLFKHPDSVTLSFLPLHSSCPPILMFAHITQRAPRQGVWRMVRELALFPSSAQSLGQSSARAQRFHQSWPCLVRLLILLKLTTTTSA